MAGKKVGWDVDVEDCRWFWQLSDAVVSRFLIMGDWLYWLIDLWSVAWIRD